MTAYDLVGFDVGVFCFVAFATQKSLNECRQCRVLTVEGQPVANGFHQRLHI